MTKDFLAATEGHPDDYELQHHPHVALQNR